MKEETEMKKILSLVLAALMVFSVVPAAFAGESTTAATTSEYQDAIDFLKLLDLYKGNGEGDAADELVQRYQMAIFAARFQTGHTDGAYWATVENDSGFSDVTDFDGAGAETLGAISYASQVGIVNGVGGDIFDPTSNVTYRDAITMVMRALGYTNLQYPWGYVQTAATLGVTDGITGIGLTDKIAREVVAQLLYNALFVEVNGKTVAESVFGVGATVVMVTASKKVSYSDSTTVASTANNKVRYAELNAQGEPLNSASYHGDYSVFGIANDAEANAAVGTTYYVVYKNNFANILSAKSLNTVYTNNGVNDANVKLSGTTLTIGGQALTVVSAFEELNNTQGWLANTKGEMGVKLYKSFGTSKKVAAGYMLASNGNVYTVDSNGAPVIYAYYSALLDAYYVIEGGKYVEKNLDDILYTSAGTNKGFTQKTADTTTKLELYQSAYAKFIATDSNMDGEYDRVTYRTYAFGRFNKKTISGKTYFTFDQAVSYNNELGTTTPTTNNAKVTDYRWTGVDYSKVDNGSYVLYYIDNANAEVDIVKVIDSSYKVTGYVRSIAKDAASININGVDYAIGYDTLAGSPLKSNTYAPAQVNKNFQSTTVSENNYYNNLMIVSSLLNTYVTLTVIDGKVVKIDAASNSTDFVIIDSFVDFTENGIVANAYTTVTDEYTEITISAFNGWTVGGFDYYLYFLSGLLGNNSNYASVLPVSLNTIYQVVSSDNGVYNLTTATAKATNKTFAVNQYGYITSDYAFNTNQYTATTDGDYWLILDTTAGKVYSFKGKLNTITLAGMDVYKAANADYVLVGDMSNVSTDAAFGTNITFMMYNKYIGDTANNYWLSSSTQYNYTIYMTNVLTGAVELVTIDPSLVTSGWNGLNGSVNLTEGGIYRVVDGKLTTNVTVTAADVAAFYANTANYVTAGALTYTGSVTTNKVCEDVASAIVTALYGSWGTNGNFANTLKSNVTVYYIKDVTTPVSIQYLTSAKYNNTNATLTGNYTVNYVIAKDGTAIAWATKNGAAFSTATLSYNGTVSTIAATYTEMNGSVTINVDLSADPITNGSLVISDVAGYTVTKSLDNNGNVIGLQLTGTTVPTSLNVTITRGTTTFTVALVR